MGYQQAAGGYAGAEGGYVQVQAGGYPGVGAGYTQTSQGAPTYRPYVPSAPVPANPYAQACQDPTMAPLARARRSANPMCPLRRRHQSESCTWPLPPLWGCFI